VWCGTSGSACMGAGLAASPGPTSHAVAQFMAAVCCGTHTRLLIRNPFAACHGMMYVCCTTHVVCGARLVVWDACCWCLACLACHALMPLPETLQRFGLECQLLPRQPFETVTADLKRSRYAVACSCMRVSVAWCSPLLRSGMRLLLCRQAIRAPPMVLTRAFASSGS